MQVQQHVSDVARIRQQIAAEYTAGQLGLYGPSAFSSRHDFIEAKQARVGELHQELQKLVGDEAIALVIETCRSVETVTRSDVLRVLQREFGKSEETELLCTNLQEVWKTIDLLIDRFEVKQAHKIILAPSSSVRDIPPS